MSSRKGVNPLSKEECVLRQSSQAVSQPASTVGRQQDDRAVVRASDGERDRVKSYMSEVWTGEALTRTRRQRMKLSSNTASTIRVSDDVNKTATVLNNPLQFKIPGSVLNRSERAHDIIIIDWTGEINKLFIEKKCDLTSQEELSTDEAKELADSLNLRLKPFWLKSNFLLRRHA